MSAEITVLDNGLTVVTHSMAHLETTSLGLWVGVGARHESPAEHGISHLLEHMSFKGTAKRSARVIAEEIEAVGGELNAATGLEMTSYFARVLKGDEGVAVELLADILLELALRPRGARSRAGGDLAGDRRRPRQSRRHRLRARARGRLSGTVGRPVNSRHTRQYQRL